MPFFSLPAKVRIPTGLAIPCEYIDFVYFLIEFISL